MKLQIAFDIPDIDKCIEVAKKVEPYCDRFEICSILLYKYGIEAIKKFREAFPEKELLAETQIVERGKAITSLCIEAGADWVTVMAGAPKQIIHNVCSAAGSKKNVMLDLADSNLIGQAAMDAKALGVDGILFQKIPLGESQPGIMADQWEIVRGNTDLPVYLGANVNRDTIQDIITLNPNGVVISKIITEHENPEEEAKFFYNLINGKQAPEETSS